VFEKKLAIVDSELIDAAVVDSVVDSRDTERSHVGISAATA
jgi:hypothetical protein